MIIPRFITIFFIMLVIILLNMTLLTNWYDLDSSDILSVSGCIVAGFILLALDSIFARRNMSLDEEARRQRRGALLVSIRTGLLLALLAGVSLASYLGKGNEVQIILLGVVGINCFIVCSALATGLIPLRHEHADRRQKPVTFWILTLFHLLAGLCFALLFLIFL